MFNKGELINNKEININPK